MLIFFSRLARRDATVDNGEVDEDDDADAAVSDWVDRLL
jgi:hypothetical protein